MFNKNNESKQLEMMVSLIKEKFNLKGGTVRIKAPCLPNTVSVMLTNHTHGSITLEMDGRNIRPIEFLQGYNGSVTKEEHEHYDYWSYSVITFDKAELKEIINGLEALSTPENEPASRFIGSC